MLQRMATILAAVLVLGSCSSLDAMLGKERPEAAIRSVQLSGISIDSARLAIDLEVKNPYSVALPVAALQAVLSSQGQRIVETSHDGQISVPPRGSSIIPLEVDLSFVKMTQLVSSLRPGMAVPYRADLTVSVDAPVLGRVAIPLSHEDEFPIPAPPGIHLRDMVLDRAGLDGVAGRISLDLTNSNDFDMSQAIMDLNLMLGGRSLSRATLGEFGSLAAGATRSVDLDFSLSPAEVGLGLINMITGRSTAVQAVGEVGFDSRFGPIKTGFDNTNQVGISKR